MCGVLTICELLNSKYIINVSLNQCQIKINQTQITNRPCIFKSKVQNTFFSSNFSTKSKINKIN